MKTFFFCFVETQSLGKQRERERGVNINYNTMMNTLIKFRAGCSVVLQSWRAATIYSTLSLLKGL